MEKVTETVNTAVNTVNTAVNDYVRFLFGVQTNYLVPFFENEIVVLVIAAVFILLITMPPKNDKTDKLFNKPIYRLLWILMIILLTLYRPYIGLLSAISYLTFII